MTTDDMPRSGSAASAGSTDTAPPPPPPSAPPRPMYPPLNALRRSCSDRKLAGVSGGLGRYAGVDPLIFRILFVVLTFFGGSGLLLYALGWLLIAADGEAESEGQKLLHGRTTSSVAKAVALLVVIVIAVSVFGATLDTGPGLGGLGVLAVIGVVAFLLLRNGQPPVAGSAPLAPTYSAVPSPEPGSYGQTTGTAYSTTAPAYPPVAPAYGPPAPPSYTGPSYPDMPPPPPPPPRPRSILGRVTVSTAMIIVGLMLAWNFVADNDFTAVSVLATALAVVGSGLVVGAVRGRARGLVFLGVVLTIATAVAAAAERTFDGGRGDETWAPQTVSAVLPVYEHGAGDAQLDLSALDFAEGEQVVVRADLGAGDLTVFLPQTATVDVQGEVGLGHLELLDQEEGGPGLQDRVLDPVGAMTPNIILEASVGFGSLEVRRATS